jgi:hypothetical protein
LSSSSSSPLSSWSSERPLSRLSMHREEGKEGEVATG